MGIFKSIFTSNKKTNTTYILRQSQYKDELYFLEELKRISKWENSYKSNQGQYLKSHVELLPSHYYANYTLMFQKIQVSYSLGIEIKTIKTTFNNAFINFCHALEKQSAYTDFLNVISLSTLLNFKFENFKIFSDLFEKPQDNDNFKSLLADNLIWFLMKNKLEKTSSKPNKVAYPELTKSLSLAIESSSEEAIRLVHEYLDEWYTLNKDMAWYDSHKRQWGYSGYWCWEAGAVVKVMGLDDSSFKDHPHYPYDMVHWQDKVSV
ncbi:PoNe immunity protein domain-containing protein [Zobellia uliginosa]|uniref:PoNe immunity protein domain-containing protein n=1 Tax=Zobellia uliginosa TaxID=143224 RepID=UPI001C07C2C5|nr:PoNe immunity protein domain-containing protein [Zobellia uliginosa]MBU2946299.1 DUF1911 domain-containing protein [Zobellia uliginosa]